MEKDVGQFVDFSTKKTRMYKRSEFGDWVIVIVSLFTIAMVVGWLYQNGIIN